MPGHNAINNLNNNAISSHGGRVIGIVSIGATNPNTAVPRGYIPGALLINTTGTTSNQFVFVNQGTIAASSWTTIGAME